MLRNPSPPRPLPPAFDPEALALTLEHLREGDAPQRALADSAQAQPWIAALAGHSPYLAELLQREAELFQRFLAKGPEDAFKLCLAPLKRVAAGTPRAALGALLRQVKRRAALVIAAADISGQWPLDRVTGALSTLAEECLQAACRHLLRTAVERGELKRVAARGAKGCGLVILGMGKFGARELNYSSDIDLIVMFDPEAAIDPDEAQHAYVRIARDLVRLMEERTAEGYVFRTDLRLRPDPSATPLAVPILSAISYYESMGATWERAAMIKARPVAGDIAAGEAFLNEIRPFVWRRHLDFAALADIHSIKRQIHEHQADKKGAHDRIQVPGHNVKLGRGGIREIEFTAQALQLIWGGRDPALRNPTTLGALTALVTAGKLDRAALAGLSDAYVFLRELEHRLQMIEDRQTHQMPEDEAGIARIASLMGYPNAEALGQDMTRRMAVVEAHYTRVFEGIVGVRHGGEFTMPTGPDDAPEAVARLQALGFKDGASALAMLRGWEQGRVRATRSDRARMLLQGLLPSLLETFAQQAEPDHVLARFDAMLARLPVGVQILSLMARNPMLLQRVANILGAAPYLADHLANAPAAFEALLGHDPAAPLPVAALVRDARHFEEALDSARRLATERRFEIDTAMLEGRLTADEAGGLRSGMADAVIGAIMPAVAEEFAIRHGRIEGGSLAMLALGKLGGREMLPRSDLDIVLLYEHAEDAEASSGGTKSLAPSEYFIRLSHQVVAALSAPGAEGKLFDVDMRLRPTGNKGPVATRLASFSRYHAEESWTWERMALLRGRVVGGEPAFRARVEAALRVAQLRPLPPGKALADAAAMRGRMLRDLPPEGAWDLKAMPGGMIEVEFIAQALTLEHAPHQPGLLVGNTKAALTALGAAGLLPEHETLVRAETLWRTLLGLRRLMAPGPRDAALSAAAEAALLYGAGQVLGRQPVDLPALRTQIEEHAAAVRAAFIRHIGRPEAGETP
ncbi:bifunctional [glutamine synthetase] adenylyltransferase/[glutamine synthetase]-adenylyl-L-tyrosine phosphorylase [Rhodovarius lipocyclicus]|uniref:bifunctional [glutamine synthetase] adenylyltransferase/[glutamine synthetase]-adenylyl-L-tyrosine phosphorylase n=1 Tax=Rhodovarius lipocyclicus TaxID=268410 RepID=UPI0013587D3B|nr:bifunctional [glutamine synthetase] adenylyltransferase/[glutamine synthetase]-adenylyl-L-tyrosine phosphorylase [Rhodovarius lipocyclicus]